MNHQVLPQNVETATTGGVIYKSLFESFDWINAYLKISQGANAGVNPARDLHSQHIGTRICE